MAMTAMGVPSALSYQSRPSASVAADNDRRSSFSGARLLTTSKINDISLPNCIAVSVEKHATFMPHTVGRYSAKRFRKAQCPIMEKLINSLMMHGCSNVAPVKTPVCWIDQEAGCLYFPVQAVNRAMYLLTTGVRKSAFRKEHQDRC